MRTIPQTPLVRVKTARPYVAARQRWKERMAVEQQRHHERVESVPDERCDDGGRESCEEREPIMNESAPLRYSQAREEEERGNGSTANRADAPATRLGEDNVKPLTCKVMLDNDLKNGRISLVGLIKNTPGALTSSAPNSGDLTSIDRRMQTLAVAHQQARKQAQRIIQDKSVATRRRLLMNSMGMQKFYKALKLIREVKGIREKLLRSCSSKDLTKPASKGKIRVCKVKFEALPKPGRDLLLKTDLVAAVERTELDLLGKLPWDELIQQAQENLFNYREYVSISETRE